MEQIIFYTLAIVTVIATILAITEKHPVHAIIYLVTSFFSLAVIFFLLSAPMIAAFEVIIYAGAVMVLFMFVVMMLEMGRPEDARRPALRHCLPALLLSVIILVSLVLLLTTRSLQVPDGLHTVTVTDFALTLFKKYSIAIEIISMQLLFAIVGVLYLGRRFIK